jgi:hypothetical protein
MQRRARRKRIKTKKKRAGGKKQKQYKTDCIYIEVPISDKIDKEYFKDINIKFNKINIKAKACIDDLRKKMK